MHMSIRQGSMCVIKWREERKEGYKEKKTNSKEDLGVGESV